LVDSAIQPPDLKAENHKAGDHYDQHGDNGVTELGNGCLQPFQASGGIGV
jgi:hypothetical protein